MDVKIITLTDLDLSAIIHQTAITAVEEFVKRTGTPSADGHKSPYMTSEEAAAYINMSPNNLMHLARQGKIGYIRDGKKYAFTREHLTEYMEKGNTNKVYKDK